MCESFSENTKYKNPIIKPFKSVQAKSFERSVESSRSKYGRNVSA